jgi:branched-chain amino acid aminotransferase
VTQYAYFCGEIVPIEQAKVSIMTNTFNYGTGCFGGIRGYWNADRQQLYVFRILDHYRRFLDSARILLARLDYTPEQLAAITVDLLAKEGWQENCYIRPIAYKADESIVVRLHDLKDEVTIFSRPVGNYLPIAEGISVGTSSWRRVDDTMIPARGKIIGSYANSALIKSEAQLNGFDDALVLNEDGHISEGSAANFAMIRNGVLVTPPTSSNILEGITRRTILQLAQHELGLPVEIREIDRSEVYLAEETFFCGTGAQVSPIVSIDRRPIGTGKVGPVVSELQALYFRVVKGEEEAYMNWLTPVPKPEQIAA